MGMTLNKSIYGSAFWLSVVASGCGGSVPPSQPVPAPFSTASIESADPSVPRSTTATSPGHTAGHVAVFDPSTGVLVAGDALRATAGLEGPDARYTSDMAQAAASVRKLAALDVKTILPGHSAPVTTGAADALAKLADSLK